ncbi:hypothetical protein P167DRAFT_537882, partial [Morchella conica CCBAS932]
MLHKPEWPKLSMKSRTVSAGARTSGSLFTLLVAVWIAARIKRSIWRACIQSVSGVGYLPEIPREN